jgi:predicted ABC-type ATPase
MGIVAQAGRWSLERATALGRSADFVAQCAVPAFNHGMPHVIVIAGPNGAGKSTLAPGLLDGFLGIEDFVNADVIARGLSAFNPAAADIQAGRIMLARLRELAAEGRDFAFETTLASRSFAPWIARLREQRGYTFLLNYIWVGDPELSIERVARRVRAGGHHVPPEIVRRRYEGGLRNFFELYQPISDTWRVLDNREGSEPRPAAEGLGETVTEVYDDDVWQRMLLLRRSR